MGSINNTVHYCSVSKGNQTLYEYSGGVHEIKSIAALCLERTPPFHKWYFERIGKRTFGFLMDAGYVYFTIVEEGVGNPCVLHFLEELRDEFENVTKMDSRGSFSGLTSISLQEKLVPVIHCLITSVQYGTRGGNDRKSKGSSFDLSGLSSLPMNGNPQSETSSSTKSPLLGKSSKHEKKPNDQPIGERDTELGEHWKSTGRGVKFDATLLDCDNQNGAGSSISLQRDLGSTRNGSEYQDIQSKWGRQVRTVLAIVAAAFIILFMIWLSICKGIKCIKQS